MQIKSILAAAVIALAASVGSAYAADSFATLDGVSAQTLSGLEMDQARGTAAGIHLEIPFDGADSSVGGEDFIEGVVLAATVEHLMERSVPVVTP